MPFRPHYRVTALGRLGTSGERFSYGFNIAPNNGTGTAGGSGDVATYNTTAWADVAADVRSFHARPTSHIHPLAILETVKVALIGADGKYDRDPLIFDVEDVGGGMGSVGASLLSVIVPQSSLAVSLVTNRRGPTGKGRFYIPMPVVGLEPASLLMVTADADEVEDSAKVLINDVNNAPGFDAVELKVCVASTKGYNTEVTAVRIGRVVDTIRSRRRSLNESYGPSSSVS